MDPRIEVECFDGSMEARKQFANFEMKITIIRTVTERAGPIYLKARS